MNAAKLLLPAALFAAMFALAVVSAAPGIVETIAAPDSYDLTRIIGRDVYTLDSSLTLSDCVRVLPVDSSYACERH